MEPQKEYYKKAAATVIKNLEKRQIEGYYCETSAKGVEKVLELMPKGSSIGWGGSETLTQMGLLQALDSKKYNIIDRALASSIDEKKAMNSKLCCSDFFLMSTNAISLDGELVNIDGHGSRVSFMIYGPDNVIICAGMNKLTADLDSAILRARNTAAPTNTVRLNRNTPCTITGRCENCFSKDCICSQFVVTRRSSIPARIKVILIGENLGY